jgi:hypothetical protein
MIPNAIVNRIVNGDDLLPEEIAFLERAASYSTPSLVGVTIVLSLTFIVSIALFGVMVAHSL